LSKISDAKLNQDEKLLGVASIRGSTPEVILYEVNDGFNGINNFKGFKSSIKYVDFSTDSYYLQCEDNLGEVSLFQISTGNQINLGNVDFDLEWLGEGLRTYPHLE
jgi:hypothetical protein